MTKVHNIREQFSTASSIDKNKDRLYPGRPYSELIAALMTKRIHLYLRQLILTLVKTDTKVSIQG